MSFVGTALLVFVLATTPPAELVPHSSEVVVFAIALVLGECLPMRIVHHGSEGEITTSSTFALALLLIAGAPATMVVMTIAAIVADGRQRKSLSRALFNVGQYAIAVQAAAFALELTTDIKPGMGVLDPNDLLGALAAAFAFFVVNAILVARAVSLVEGAPFWRYLRTDLAMQTSTVGILLGLGPIVVITSEFSLFALPLLALPLVAIHRAGRRAVAHQHDALHDALTGLPNRILLHDRLEQALLLARREGGGVAVMLLDLDGFKEINDTLGHHEGDSLLCDVAERLAGAVRASDTVARLGGDEFAIVLRDTRSPSEALRIAGGLAGAMARPFDSHNGLRLDVRASIGVAMAPQHGQDAATLIRHADIAMYQAKHSGGGEQLYAAARDDSSPERLQLVADLRAAIESRELVMHFQPKVALETGRVEGLEALARWEHPRRGLLTPEHFIDIAERSGLIGPLTLLALDCALVECRAWRDAGLEVTVAVNLSARSLRDGRIVADVEDALTRHGLPGRLLQLEITENSFVADPETARRVLNELRALGVTIAIDDFGTGYSSLAHLKDLPVDELKIDRKFVRGLVSGSADAAIVRSTVQLAHDLGLRVVAEGVEESSVLVHLKDVGCDAVQGFLFGRPAPASALWPVLEGGDAALVPVAA